MSLQARELCRSYCRLFGSVENRCRPLEMSFEKSSGQWSWLRNTWIYISSNQWMQAYELDKKICEAYDDYQRVLKLDPANR